MYKSFKIILFSVFVSFSQSFYAIDENQFVQNPKIILFDIGETLISIDQTKTFTYLGPLKVMDYLVESIFHGIFNFGGHMKSFYLDTLAHIPSPIGAPDYEILCVNNKPMPALLRDTMIGKLSFEQCREIANDWIEKNNKSFRNEKQKSIFQSIVHFNFTETSLIKHYKYTPTLKLLKRLHEAKDKKGKRKNICIILSNQPKEMVPLIESEFPEIYQYSDERVYSCYEGYAKPHQKLFEKCISLCPKLSYKKVFFIDDEKGNIDAVKTMNIQGFSIKGIYPHQARKELQDYSVL